MASTNPKRAPARAKTFEGAPALYERDPVARLRRVVNAHLLWEDSFYVDGKSSAAMLHDAVSACAVPKHLSEAARAILDARHKLNIRHASLYAAVVLAREVRGVFGAGLVTSTISRADELAEALAINASLSGSAKRMPHALRKGVAQAFTRFDAYQFAKYRGEGDAITLRDAVFLTHPKREDDLITRIVENTLDPADTWEVGLSAGGDKREVFTRLLSENRLGAMALIRNLRKMHEVGVDPELVGRAMQDAKWGKVLPMRFVSAVKHAPWAAKMLAEAFVEAKAMQPTLGFANVLVDVSGSMDGPLSGKSTLSRAEAAAALAVCWPGPYRLWVFGTAVKELPAFGGLADVRNHGNHGVGHGTEIALAVSEANRASPGADYTLVVSDMQGAGSKVPKPAGKGVMLNVAHYQNGIESEGDWTQLSGFSERVYDWLRSETQ